MWTVFVRSIWALYFLLIFKDLIQAFSRIVGDLDCCSSHSPVASFLCPLNTCSSSFKFLMSNSLHRWSRDAVSSQLPFRFHFTSITVFLWAWLSRQTVMNSRTRHSTLSQHQTINFKAHDKLYVYLHIGPRIRHHANRLRLKLTGHRLRLKLTVRPAYMYLLYVSTLVHLYVTVRDTFTLWKLIRDQLKLINNQSHVKRVWIKEQSIWSGVSFRFLMNSQRRQTLSGLWVPEFDWLLAVFTAGDDQAFSGMPVDTLHVSTVTYTHVHLL